MGKEHPIIFNTEMVKAILDDRKTQTRRVIKKGGVQYCRESGLDKMGEVIDGVLHYTMQTEVDASAEYEEKCPYGKIGDRLWVRETWMHRYEGNHGRQIKHNIIHKAGKEYYGEYFKWKPSIHMPRWASRIDLEITDIRVKRIQDITIEDVFKEGIEDVWTRHGTISPSILKEIEYEFSKLWDSINAKRGYGWEVNPFVWCISFKREVVNG